ncbi:MAG: hypothetical protein J0M17_12445 [Planctomycetes bacterium]|nr:hypothetical protein [Planctomycetota bacterium]
MPRDTWRNSRKPKEFKGDDTSIPYQTEAERTAYYKNNAEKIRREHKQHLQYLKDEREMEKAAAERKRKKQAEKSRKATERNRLIKLGFLPDKRKKKPGKKK